MTHIVRNCLLAAAMLLLASCAALDMRRAVPSSAASSIRSIGVVSSLGTEFNATYIGVTIFNNKAHKYSVPNWKIEEFAIGTATEYLNSLGRYEARSLGNSFGDRDYDRMLAEARSAGHDTLIVLTPTSYDNAPHYVGGYGLHRRIFFGGPRDCIYTLFVTQVFDVATGAKLGWEWSFPTTSGIGCYGRKDLGEEWDNSVEWQESLAGYTEAQQEILRSNVLASMSESVPRSLKKLGFQTGGKTPN